ncbi:MAG: alkaline phosphatase [Paracoccus sp. (in: a-proteobacteria)]|uniref:alkaline phosphatase n=1 Tax=Paracoccus sp. TaxID=267 RepID=UPI0026E08265|nr:alkaline phosphatase [Paracoccus sp. (in: a-proteobacteria)]MDO5631698.1 alkaline phosphatase [Paracoccus sp. (in: a-proteobacteria)]
MNITLRPRLLAAVSIAALSIPMAGHASVKNVIMMISDGASWGTWDMASYWEFGEKGRQVYDRFDVKLGMTTQPLNTSSVPTYDNIPRISYDPAKAWDGTINADGSIAGYEYIKQGYTDSAAAGTALSTGQKTYNNAISVDNFANPLRMITDGFKEADRSVGVVTSVPLSHATPAAFGAHNISRNHYGELAHEMVFGGKLDLIMGTGHPEFHHDSVRLDAPVYAAETGRGGGYIPESVWENLRHDPNPAMTLIETRADFEALASGSLSVEGRLIGVPQVHGTLQQSRRDSVVGLDSSTPSGVAYNTNVPTLATMTTGALNHLGKNENGFFVMIEGGAVDWAAHANDTGRIIEEQIDFNHSVVNAVNWVEANSNWDETMLLVLTDHGNGMPMGPNSDVIPFEPIQNLGAGVLPGVTWHYGTHTIENTLLWAHGAGAQALFDQVIGTDEWLVSLLGHNTTGAYIDNTGLYGAISQAAGLPTPAPVPLPAGAWLMIAGLGALAALRRRRHLAA